MSANYLHGVETVEVDRGPRPVTTVKSAVIGLIGTAPIGPVNETILWLSENDSAQFGPQLTSFTIPQALDMIAGYGAATVIVVNVLNPAIHKSRVEEEDLALSAVTDRGQLAHGGLTSLALTDTGGETIYVADTDYTVDLVNGLVVRIKGGAIAAGATLKATYDYADPSLVTTADILGTVNSAGNRTGMKALKDTYNDMGFFAKILISPAFATLNSVSSEMIALADELGAIAYMSRSA